MVMGVCEKLKFWSPGHIPIIGIVFMNTYIDRQVDQVILEINWRDKVKMFMKNISPPFGILIG